MKFLLDHDVPADVARVMSQAGHEVALVKDVMAANAADVVVFDYAVRHGFILLSCNRDDFLRLADERQHLGLVIVIRRKTRITECAHVLQLLKKAGRDGLAGNVNFA